MSTDVECESKFVGATLDNVECGKILIIYGKLFDVGDGRAVGKVGKQNEFGISEEHELYTSAMEGSDVDGVIGGGDFKDQVKFR